MYFQLSRFMVNYNQVRLALHFVLETVFCPVEGERETCIDLHHSRVRTNEHVDLRESHHATEVRSQTRTSRSHDPIVSRLLAYRSNRCPSRSFSACPVAIIRCSDLCRLPSHRDYPSIPSTIRAHESTTNTSSKPYVVEPKSYRHRSPFPGIF